MTKITYYTVTSTRCMGMWRVESLKDTDGNDFCGFETYEDAKTFVESFPKRMENEFKKNVRNVKLTADPVHVNEWILEYQSFNVFYDKWTNVSWRLGINIDEFSTVAQGTDPLKIKFN